MAYNKPLVNSQFCELVIWARFRRTVLLLVSVGLCWVSVLCLRSVGGLASSWRSQMASLSCPVARRLLAEVTWANGSCVFLIIQQASSGFFSHLAEFESGRFQVQENPRNGQQVFCGRDTSGLICFYISSLQVWEISVWARVIGSHGGLPEGGRFWAGPERVENMVHRFHVIK